MHFNISKGEKSVYFNNLRNFVGEAIVLILLLAVGIFFIPVLTLSNISNLIGYSAVLTLLTGLFLITHHHAVTGCILTFLLNQAMFFAGYKLFAAYAILLLMTVMVVLNYVMSCMISLGMEKTAEGYGWKLFWDFLSGLPENQRGNKKGFFQKEEPGIFRHISY